MMTTVIITPEETGRLAVKTLNEDSSSDINNYNFYNEGGQSPF